MSALPKWFMRCLSRFAANAQQASFCDDMAEEYSSRVEIQGRRRAACWLWKQLFRMLPVMIGFHIYWRFVMLANYLRIALRVLKKNKGFSSINIFGLSMGLAVFLIIFLYVGYESSFDGFHEDTDRIYRLTRHMPGHYHAGKDKMAYVPYAAAPAVTDAFPEVDAYNRVTLIQDARITVDQQPFFEKRLLFADDNFFGFYSFDLIQGDPGRVLSEPHSIVLSERVSNKYFGTADVVGRTILWNDDVALTVSGVMETMPRNTQFESDFVISLDTWADMFNRDLTVWGGGLYAFIRLGDGIDARAFNDKMQPFVDQHMPQHGQFKQYLFLQSLKSIHLRVDIDGEMALPTDVRTLRVFGTVALLILIVACINYMNLTTARSGLRMKEVGMRKVAGAQRNQLVRQFMGESFFMVFLAMVLALALVTVALPTFNRFVDRSIGLQALFSFPMAAWILTAFAGVGFLAGSYPALVLSKFRPVEVFQAAVFRKRTGLNLRAVLVVFQFTVSLILLISMMTVRKQLHYIRDFRVGYEKEQILVFPITDGTIRGKLDVIKSELSQFPDVRMVSSSMSLPNEARSQTRLVWPGMPEDLEIPTYVVYGDFDFVDLYGLELAAGRNFSEAFPSDREGAFLLNETAARLLEWDDAVGRELINPWESKTRPVVGIVKDFHFHSLHRPVEPLWIYFEPQKWNYWLSVKIDGGDLPGTVERIESYLNQYATRYPFEYRFFDEVFDEMYRSEMRLERVFTVFAVLAILIAGLGLLGLASFMAARRTKEIGIRKVLGSSETRLMWNLLSSFLKWVLVANVLAWPVAWWTMQRWLQDFSYKTPMTLDLFVWAGLSATLVAAALISVQSVRTARANPVDALRYE